MARTRRTTANTATKPAAKKLVRLTRGQKLQLCRAARADKRTVPELKDWAKEAFQLGTATISERTIYRILASHDELEAAPEAQLRAKKKQGAAFYAFDERLLAAFDAMEEQLDSITGQMIVRLARHVADETGIPAKQRPRFSLGWLCKFQKRHGIKLRPLHGDAASVSAESVHAGRQVVLKLTDQYALSNIYNMDETALYYRQEPKATLTRRKKRAGRKSSKDRVTLCLATNADGSDKLPPMIIGTAKCPRDLKGHDVKVELGIEYTRSRKAWINSPIFTKWLTELNARMKAEERKILLLVDNYSSHVRPAAELSHIRLEFLPKNTTSVLQPLDQGIIQCVKRKFSSIKEDAKFVLFLAGMAPVTSEKVSLYDGLQCCKQAWDSVSVETIENCWFHSGIVSGRRKISSLLNPCNLMAISELLS